MPKGTIKFFSDKKGFGFISIKNSKDIFFHVSEWRGKVDPAQGDEVSFEIKEGKKGEMAGDIHRV